MKIITFLIFSFPFLLLEEPPDVYPFTHQINENLIRDTTSLAFHNSAWEYSFIGEYQKALWAFDQVFRNYATLSDEERAYFLSFRAVSAYDFILRRAEREKIIMINEAHHQPIHRTFTTSLLKGLYDKGYRFLGLEALSHSDTLLNERGYPILSTGYYTKEPQFGNLIREALSIGYELFPYESQSGANGKEREIQQARNMQQMIEAHPQGKFLIHCGFDHINEAAAGSWEKAMAGRIKEYTGIDPFTINQEILTERYLQEKENPFFKMVDTLKQTSVFIKEDGDLFRGNKGDERFDVRLFHPRTTYANGRPSWLMMDGERSIYMIDVEKVTIEYPVMIKAYLEEEAQDAVPVDVIEIEEYSNQKALVLPGGRYHLNIHNSKGDSLQITAIIN